jgi:hypothetical protein
VGGAAFAVSGGGGLPQAVSARTRLMKMERTTLRHVRARNPWNITHFDRHRSRS